MKTKIKKLAIAFTLIFAISITAYFYITRVKAEKIQSVPLPDGNYKASVPEYFSPHPPNQSIFISNINSREFRYADILPENNEAASRIVCSPESGNALFQANWHSIIADINSLNVRKINLNPLWWKWNRSGTFSTPSGKITVEVLRFINSEMLKFKTNGMANAKIVQFAAI